jgi:phosphoglycolate phosphatase-like HAD superfamily hydrolase
VIRNIIFDWSGTLVDDLPAVLAATNHVFAKSGRPPMGIDEFRAEFCLPFTHFYDKHTPNIPLPILEDWFHQYFKTAQHLVTDLEHAREFLRFCRERAIRMFVLSTIHEEYFVIHTKLNGFGRFFERAYLAVRDKRAKIGEVLAENRLAPDETLFIGDMQHDIDTARHGGILSCAVLTGYNRIEQLRASDPHIIVENLGQLRRILDDNNFELPAAGPDVSPSRPVQGSPGFPVDFAGGGPQNEAQRPGARAARKRARLIRPK